ncbi:MAG: PIG-L family deacetylase [Egibacteraceae bacterium]
MPELTLLCVHAHPDDEAIATGGVLARYAEEGIRTAVVTCTGGERGEVVGPGMDPGQVTPHLSAVRYEELARSLEILKSGPPRLLGYLDSGMTGTDGNGDPASFWLAAFDQAVGRMVAQIRELRPDVLVTDGAFGVYGHPDHIQAHRVASAAIEAAEVAALYPEVGPAWRVRKVYYFTVPKSGIVRLNAWLAERGIPSPFGDIVRAEDLPFGTPDERVTTVVDVLPWLDRKREALLAHVSQSGPDSFFFTTPDEFFARECFVRQRSDVLVPVREDDLFAGLRG